MIFVFTEVAYSITEGQSSFRSCSSGKFLTFSSAEYYAGSCRWWATSKMNSNCNYPTSCTVHATNSWLDNDPCVGSVKTLTWGESCTGNNSIFVYALLSNCNALLYKNISYTLYIIFRLSIFGLKTKKPSWQHI